MVRKLAVGLGIAAGALAAVGVWSLYQRRATESVPYSVVATVGDVELRRYPAGVVAETTAGSRREAFGRLFRYISGANQAESDISMTAPVEVGGRGASIPMTTPVSLSGGMGGRSSTSLLATGGGAMGDGNTDGEGDPAGSDLRMAFYLPPEYDEADPPRPTEDGVELRRLPERTRAVRRFSGRPTRDRVERERTALLEALDRADVPTTGDVDLLAYDAPWTLPFLRRNEVAVDVHTDG